jgi:hypothetical protein
MKAERALEKVSWSEERWARALFREKAKMDYRSEKNKAKPPNHGRLGRSVRVRQAQITAWCISLVLPHLM